MGSNANLVGTIILKDIYVITNTINNKQYVGQSLNSQKRFYQHCKESSDTLISRAIKKYGAENFTLEVLEEQIPNYNEREIYWIQKLNTQKPNGYNLTPGGEDPPILRGEDHPNCIINDGILNNIKKDLEATKDSLSMIATRYGVSKRQVLRINQGISHHQTDWDYPLRKNPNINGKLTEQDVRDIVILLKANELKDYEIAELYGLNDYHTIQEINHGHSHKKITANETFPIRRAKIPAGALSIAETNEAIDLIMNSSLSLRQIAHLVRPDKTNINWIYKINTGSAKYYYRDYLKYPLRKY